jgi:hypothetical protein
MKRKDSGNIMTTTNYKPHPETNEEVWKECLRMWRWIAIEKIFGSKNEIYLLKQNWLKVNNYNPHKHDCFFCHITKEMGCEYCPAKLIDGEFSCYMPAYIHTDRPIRFYLKIRKLNPYKSQFHWLKF